MNPATQVTNDQVALAEAFQSVQAFHATLTRAIQVAKDLAAHAHAVQVQATLAAQTAQVTHDEATQAAETVQVAQDEFIQAAKAVNIAQDQAAQKAKADQDAQAHATQFAQAAKDAKAKDVQAAQAAIALVPQGASAVLVAPDDLAGTFQSVQTFHATLTQAIQVAQDQAAQAHAAQVQATLAAQTAQVTHDEATQAAETVQVAQDEFTQAAKALKTAQNQATKKAKADQDAQAHATQTAQAAQYAKSQAAQAAQVAIDLVAQGTSAVPVASAADAVLVATDAGPTVPAAEVDADPIAPIAPASDAFEVAPVAVPIAPAVDAVPVATAIAASQANQNVPFHDDVHRGSIRILGQKLGLDQQAAPTGDKIEDQLTQDHQKIEKSRKRRVAESEQAGCSTSITTSPESKKSKMSEKVDSSKSSGNFYMVKILESIVMEGSVKINDECKTLTEKLGKEYEEEGCFEHTISLDARFPDEENYRLLADFVNENILPPPSIIVPEGKKHAHQTPALRLTGPTSVNFRSISGAEIIELAREYIETGRNFFYDEKHSAEMPNQDTVMESEKQFFRDDGCQAVETMEGRIPVRRIELHQGFDVKDLERLVNTSPFLVIGNIKETFEMDFSKFELAELIKIIPNANIKILRQRPQPSTENVRMHGTTRSWATAMIQETVNIKEFAENLEEIQEIGREGLCQLNEHPQQHKTILEDLEKKLQKSQLPFLEKREKDFPVISFGTNIDLVSNESANFKEQLEEIAKLPDFLLPQGISTLLHLCGEDIEGINQPQVYVKAPGSRTAAHLENQLIGSININLGPGKCVWIVVAMEYSGKLEALLRKKKLHPYHTMFWPNEDELIEAGIPIMKFEQREGDCVYVGTGSYHWVQANGFATNLSWNVFQAEKFQLAAALLSHDHNAKEKYGTVLPLVSMIWRIAREKKFLETDLYPLIKSVLCRTLAKSQFEITLAESLNFEMENVDNYPELMKEVMRCCNKKCRRNVLFDMIVSDETSRGPVAKCIECSNKDPASSIVYIRYSMEELVKIFDEYKRN